MLLFVVRHPNHPIETKSVSWPMEHLTLAAIRGPCRPLGRLFTVTYQDHSIDK
jgi:hypothetical protein